MTRHVFMLVRATSEWLALPPREGFGFLDKQVRPLLARHPAVRLRFFDCEAYNARVSDVMLWETDDLSAWDSLVEGLRETAFWGRYLEVREILPAVENGYARHYGAEPMPA